MEHPRFPLFHVHILHIYVYIHIRIDNNETHFSALTSTIFSISIYIFDHYFHIYYSFDWFSTGNRRQVGAIPLNASIIIIKIIRINDDNVNCCHCCENWACQLICNVGWIQDNGDRKRAEGKIVLHFFFQNHS